ncbi:MAG: hypothetical protein O8C66_05885 [Candidatus Methanoperedens sp.]|nr:hypothetical protein [Candidatus Methanoperedens sp.]MCZ7370020.1 hypothetical protein [Candidatus Methanoperedens sp.]
MKDVIGFIIVDYMAYVIVDGFTKTTPGYGYFGWPLYIAGNAAVLYYLKNKYLK